MSSRFTVADYAGAAQALLPRGRVWNADPSSVQSIVLSAIGATFARSDGIGNDLLATSTPDQAIALLPEWETTLGLPDTCSPASPLFRDRQIAAGNKIAATGGQTKAYYIDLAARIGVAIAIDEYRPFTAGSRAGDRACGAGWQFTFTVRVLGEDDPTGTVSVSRFRAGKGRAGDRLRSGGLSGLECIIGRAAPAHATVLFTYPDTGA